jgi:outer membrane protein with beta-barrel domain
MTFRTIGCSLAILVSVAASARAQEPKKVELAVGYALMHDTDLSTSFPSGWLASIGGKVNDWFGIVGEVGGNYKTMSVGTADVSVRVHTALVGPRFSGSSASTVAPFVQLLFGAAKGSLDVSVPNVNLTVSGTHFATQAGGGLDLNFTPAFGVRVEVDLRGIRANGSNHGEGRFATALVFRP